MIRLFYGKQFIQLYEDIKKKRHNSLNLINSVVLNKIKDSSLDYIYNDKINNIENINKYLENLFEKNEINLNEIYNKNRVKKDIELTPGLYRKVKSGDFSNLTSDILNIYINLTGNIPILNTLLICNQDTNIENIKAFLFRAIFCDKPILFSICNMESLELSYTQNIIKTLRKLLKLKNKKINSYLLIIYNKDNSALSRDIGKLIPEKNILSDKFTKKPDQKLELFNKTELYSSEYSGYGKTTEIFYKCKNRGEKYYYLPIGGSFNRYFLINNLENLKINLENSENSCLHLDLSETDNDNLMNEILFKLTILRYIDSNEKIFYLGYDIHLIIEIPTGFFELDKKYKLLNLFNKIHIKKLNTLRLEENIKVISDSPISIVAEVLDLYDKNEIQTKNIDLNGPIKKSPEECEKIINKHFNAENKNYYQKMNFIKILSTQFKKFTKNPFFDYEIAKGIGKGEIIKYARISVIKNFISLTRVFTNSPYDSILSKNIKSKDFFNKYDDEKALKDAIIALANEKKEIFSFDKIKPSLVFFNLDGGSLSIISNNNKEDEEYQDLKRLWNSQNINLEGKWNSLKLYSKELDDLVDYKNMKHEEFLKQIKILFSMNKVEDKDLKKMCEELGNYIFVSDNFIKMVRILLNIEAKIPVILMGETGVGKTKLLEMLATLYGKDTKDNCTWYKKQIHAGITDQDIVSYINKVTLEVKEKGLEKETIWIFFDEINTCNSLGLITEIMCNHTYFGKKINENFVFLGACNPYRELTKKMKESGLVYYNMKEKSKLNNFVYTVNPLPHSLLNFVFDFGSLRPEDEEKYIRNTIISLMSRIKNNLIKNFDQKDIDDITEEIIKCIVICHNFIRDKYDKSSVSLREIRRFGLFLEYFIKYFKNIEYYPKIILKSSLNITLYLCYYLRLNDKQYRKDLAKLLDDFYPNSYFIKVPEREINRITGKMTIEKEKGIALNRALKENLFTCFICIDNNVPLIIVGKPGTGKSLSFQILYNTLKGKYSDDPMFKNKGKLYRYYYQGSETSTSKGIINLFDKAAKAQAKNLEKNIITLVFFDEMGLAERSSNNPLKVIHFLLERDNKDSYSVPFLGISNWRLDAAKINRALNLTITDYDTKDLEETAMSIAKALNEGLSDKYKDFFKVLARTYEQYIKFNQGSTQDNKDFHGNRDFYNLIKIAMKELIANKNELIKNEKKILTQVGILSLYRNFGGLENSTSKIREIFKENFKYKYDENNDIENKISILDFIKQNILDSNSRYLMLISEGNDGSDIAKFILNSLNRNFIELVGSKYKADIKSGRYSEEILNKIKYIMETDNVLILRDLDMIYASLYDLFNQNFTCMGEKKFARIAFEYAKISSEVNKDFHVIVIVNNNQIKELKLDPPFLNRFEKHIINFNMLLDERDIEIDTNLSEYIELIASFNNNPSLKIDLEKSLINCQKHNIEGLIFKIKNNIKEQILNKDDIEYENEIRYEILKKIVPTFCQDIIASMIYSNLDPKYIKINESIIDIYKKTHYYNFESFFKNISLRKNIIYTFSKITENLIEEDKKIENKFGIFTKESIDNEMLDSIKSENDLMFLLKSFLCSQNKKLLVFRFSEKDLNKINSLNYIINNFEKENPLITNKLIIFLIHKQRISKGVKNQTVIIPDIIPLINDDYYQIFIDNLVGKESSDVLKLIQKKNEELGKEYIDNSNFIENKIFTILNYMKYTILFETKDLNMKNYTTVIAEKIINNEYIKNLIKNNLKKQGKSITGIINEVFTSDLVDPNDVDFFEVINTKLSSYFSQYLLKIIFYSLKENILNQIIINQNLGLILKNEFFNNSIINKCFDKEDFKSIKLKMDINANKITILNGLVIPKSKSFLESIINYINKDISEKYIKNENLLRKEIKKEIEQTKQEFNNRLYKFEDNVKVEMNKEEFFKAIYIDNKNEYILNDYLKYYIINYIEKKNISYKINEKLLKFLILIIKVKLSENNNLNYEFEYTIDEFAKIILFTLGYKSEINVFFDVFIEIQKYCENIEELMIKIIEEDKIKYEESERNKKYTAIVNANFSIILESLLRGTLIHSIDLLKFDSAKFYDYLYSFTSIEANLQKINKKFFLLSKELYNLKTIIKIEESYKYNHEEFENNYEKIMNNLLKQSELIYNNEYNILYNTILNLLKIFEETFKEKKEENEEHINLLFFLFMQQYKSVYDENFRIKLLENFFKNKKLLKKSKIFLAETLRNLKPEVLNPKKPEDENKEEKLLIKNFMNLESKKLSKYKNIIKTCNEINSDQFNEILLYFFEGQCQSYFLQILEKNNNEYNEKCCEELLLKISLKYLKIAIQYLYENKNNYDNNLLKLFSIAYIKTYCYFYVEINYNHFDKCSFDEINSILYDEDENNALIRKMRNIYILRLYCQKFPNFEKFINFDFNKKKIPIYKELSEELEKENIENKDANNKNYIFKNSFITLKSFSNYKKIEFDIDNNNKLNSEEINNNFDLFYSVLINNIISFLYSNDNNKYINSMKTIYNSSYDKLNLSQEGKLLYKYLLNNDLFKNEITKKISESDLSQDEFEIFLYSLRFILNTQINKKDCFYNNILKSNCHQFINNNYIPGSFPLLNNFTKSYNSLENKMKLNRDMGYYICKDCGFLYEVPPCTFPTSTNKCPNGHEIGGIVHICSKRDIRVFFEIGDYEKLAKKWKRGEMWFKSFETTTLKEFKEKYVDKNALEPKKGIINDYTIDDFVKNDSLGNLDIITFRVLNFILYSYLLGSYILNNLKENEMKSYLVENLFPHTLFGILKKNWELLQISLVNIGIENIQTFINMIFDKLIEFIINLDSVDSKEKLQNFEKKVNDYIVEIISDKEKINSLNNEYKRMNDDLKNFNPQSIKEIILNHYPPYIYEESSYPDIQFYEISKINDINSFAKKFSSSKENENKYCLINILIKKDEELLKNICNIKNLININKLSNILLNIYSFKISREDAKIKLLKDELTYIKDVYNEMDLIKINNEDEFTKKYIDPFIEAWDKIKRKAVQFGCRILRKLDLGQEPLDMKLENQLCYFLVDKGDEDGGMFLASAYEKFIEWQNAFINLIISSNNMNGILNGYISQLEQEIYVQDATEEEIIKIDENIYKNLENLILSCSMRNIFEEENKINYKFYNNIEYNYDYIEEELGKIILPGKKRFRIKGIKFIKYLYEGFRGDDSSILVEYNTRYIQRELTNDEKESLNELLKVNNSSKFYNEVFSSLLILMNHIISENYEQNYLIYKIIESLPNYARLNEKLVNFFKAKYEFYSEEKVYTINTLVSIFEYFEALCWVDMKKNILEDYQLELNEKAQTFILDYFENNHDKLINKKNFVFALRKLISRALVGTRQETDIKSEAKLKLYITRSDLWNKEIVENDSFDKEIEDIFKEDILVGQSLKLHELLDGENILFEGIYKVRKEENPQKIENNEFEINTNQIQNKDEEKDVDENKDDDGNNENEEDEESSEKDEY